MKISPIRQTNQATPNFKATLRVSQRLYNFIGNITSFSKFEEVIFDLRKRLSADPLNASDVVDLRPLTAEAKKVCTGSYYVPNGHWENCGYAGKFVPDVIERPYSAPLVLSPYTAHTMEKENMEIAINLSRSGFLYNDERSAKQISEDMYNTYKHVRYLEHYKAIDDAKAAAEKQV